MHPPNLKLMDTTNGVRSCGESSFGKGKEISNNISERCGVNPASVFPRQHSFSEQEKENICGENLAVDNGKNKEANVEGGCGVILVSDDLPQENCIVQDKEKSCGAEMAVDNEQFGLRGTDMAVDSGENKGDDMGEDEDDDGDYDYNYWHEYCRNDCVTDEDDDDDFKASPPKRRGCGHSGTNRNRRSRPTSGRGQVSGKPASGRGQRSSATGGYKSTKKVCIWKHSEVNTE
ncbi:unnamed protein product [Brassica oleracea var. botrytis]